MIVALTIVLGPPAAYLALVVLLYALEPPVFHPRDARAVCWESHYRAAGLRPGSRS